MQNLAICSRGIGGRERHWKGWWVPALKSRRELGKFLLITHAPILEYLHIITIFGSDSKASVYNVRDLDLIPGLGRFPGEGNGHPLQYSCLKDLTDWGAWWIMSMGSRRVEHGRATKQQPPPLERKKAWYSGCCGLTVINICQSPNL